MGRIATAGGEWILRCSSLHPNYLYRYVYGSSPHHTAKPFCNKPSPSFSYLSNPFFRITGEFECNNGYVGLLSPLLPRAGSADPGGFSENDNQEQQQQLHRGKVEIRNDDPRGIAGEGSIPPVGNSAIISSCLVGLLTGISVVLFNTVVREIRDLCWDGIPYRGASWLREEPIDTIWQRVILVPACGGLVVGMLNMLRSALDVRAKNSPTSNLQVQAALQPIVKALAACVTLGTGNSLGPEGPSVEIGASVAKGVGKVLDRNRQRKLSLKAAGSAAGISSGFNAAVAGCFFAVESVLWPSPAESSFSLTNTTSMVILSAVIASVVAEIGLGSEPAFIVPEYDFRSPTELPLYLLLGILCGFVSLTLSRCTSLMLVTIDNLKRTTNIPNVALPLLGGLAVGFVALTYPEILYWGFENVDILLESRPFVKGLPADLLLQLVGVKILTTSLCRASGLVGGYYAPSLFIGAATGMAYGKFIRLMISESNPIFHLSLLEVASPQAYGLVGMAATLAGVCQVPLTSVLLLFELTQDYRIVLPLLGAVGLSSWFTSGHNWKREGSGTKKNKVKNTIEIKEPETSSFNPNVLSFNHSLVAKSQNSLCELDTSLCLDDFDNDTELAERILVSQAMKTRYVTVSRRTLLTEAIALMLEEKQSCGIVVDEDSLLIGLLTLGDIYEFSKLLKENRRKHEGLTVSEVCSFKGEKCRPLLTVSPSTNLLSAQEIMERHEMSHLPVILEHVEDNRCLPVGLLDRECIYLACRAIATKECLSHDWSYWESSRTDER